MLTCSRYSHGGSHDGGGWYGWSKPAAGRGEALENPGPRDGAQDSPSQGYQRRVAYVSNVWLYLHPPRLLPPPLLCTCRL